MNLPPNPPPPPPPPPFNAPPPGGLYPPPPPKTGLATAALVLGIVSIPTICICVGPVFGILAIILGAIAWSYASRSPAIYAGTGRAIGGIVLGGISVVLLVFALVSATTFARSLIVTGVQLTQIESALQQYQAKHQQRPPDWQALVDSRLLSADVLKSADARLFFFPDVDATDPADWPVYAARTEWMGQQLYFVHKNVAGIEPLDGVEFKALLEKFAQEYEQKNGMPPQVLDPNGNPMKLEEVE